MRIHRGAILSLLTVAFLLLATTVLGAVPAGQAPPAIHLKAVVFTPGAEAPQVAPELAVTEAQLNDEQPAYYIVQFAGPIQQGWTDGVAALGGEVLGYIPDFAFKVRMTPAQARQVATLGTVRWVGLFQPAWKLSPGIARDGVRLYTVRLERGIDHPLVAALLRATGAEISQQESDLVLVAANSAQLDAIARVADVAWIEEFVLREKFSRPLNDLGGGSVMGAATANSLGYDGSTQTVAVADTGIGGGTAATAHADIPSTRVAAIYNWAGSAGGCFQSITNDGSVDVDSGHGTHTAGSVLSDGDASGAGKGTAPAARLVFQSVENWATISSLCKTLYGYTDGYYLTGLPSDLKTLFQQAYDAGARVHSNSWGSAAAGDYTTDSVNADTFIWSHRDMAITFSAGNEGIDANSDGVIDNDSMGSPATAKNVITVGASENDRQGNWQCDASLSYTACASQGGQNSIFTYGAAWPSDYPANPIKDDLSAGNPQQMAAFSSRGPTDDSRIKPDVVAPGTWVLSAYSDLYQQGYDGSPNPKNNAYQYDGWGYPFSQGYKYMGGTSMSNPLTAGGAAVVKDYYQEAKGVSASAALVKATLINSAVDMLDENNDGVANNALPIPNNHEGWGRVDLAAATDGTAQFLNEGAGLSTNGAASYPYTVNAAGAPLKITVVWSDYPSTSSASINLVNDLDLEVTSPGGALYRGNVFSGGWSQTGGSADRRNNVENVYIQSAEAGTWTVTVRGYNVPSGPQNFALVVDGNLGSTPPGPTNTPTATPTVTVTPTVTNTPTPTGTPTQAPGNTGWLSPSANAPVTSGSGDNNGFESNPANAYSSNNARAVDNNSGTGTSTSYTSTQKDRHLFYNFNINVPEGATIKGIEVRLEALVDSTSGTPRMYVDLSYNGGTSWSAAKSTARLSRTDTTYTLGTATDTWGRTWASGELSNANLRVRVTNVASNTSRDFSLDWIAVQVTYQ